MVIAPSAIDFESSKSSVRSTSETVPRPSQRGHMPPVTVKVRRSVLLAPRSIVSKTSELLPEPETPVHTVSRRFGISTLTSLRLFSRAPCTRMRSCDWAACIEAVLGILHEARDVAVGVLDGGHELAAADVARLLLDGRASSDELLDRLVDIVNKP